MRWKTRLLIAILSLLPSTVLAQLSVSLDDQDYLVLSAENLDLLAIELQSASSSLLISEDLLRFRASSQAADLPPTLDSLRSTTILVHQSLSMVTLLLPRGGIQLDEMTCFTNTVP